MSKKQRGRKKLEYEVLEDAQKLAKSIIETYSEIFGNLQKDSDKIIVLGILNEPPIHKNWAARIRPISGIFKTIAEMNKIKTKFIIETYKADWAEMSQAEREWTVFHELLHIIDLSITRMFKHDVQDFHGIVEIIGPNAYGKENLKSLLDPNEKIKFSEWFIERRNALIQQIKEKHSND